jgi:hypothetical protein
MIHKEFEQGTEEWTAYKMGRISGSRLQDILAEPKTKGQRSASWRNYMAELCVERLTGKSSTHFTSKAMDYGTETEPLARMEYEARNLVNVEQVGFIDHPTIPMCGVSPDGLIGLDGGFESKCPNTATHIDRLFGEGLESRYFAQVQWGMECSGRHWWDFVSFDPDLPENCQFYCKRIMRDEPFLINARTKVIEFQAELEAMIEKLKSYVPSNA